MADGHIVFSEKLLLPGLIQIPSSVKTETPQCPTETSGVKVEATPFQPNDIF